MKTKRKITVTGLCLTALLIAYSFVNVSFYKPRNSNGPTADFSYSVYSGAVHVHSKRSDGSGTVKEIAQAAARAGLDYVVITDHDAGPEARSDAGYYGNILVLTGSEISTQEGHFLYIPHPDSLFYSPDAVRKRMYNFNGAAPKEMAGLVVGAHPLLKKRPMAPEAAKSIHGIEIINADAQWRNGSKWNLFQAFVTYLFMDYSLNIIAHYPLSTMNLWTKTIAGSDNGTTPPQKRGRLRFPIIFGSMDAHANVQITDSWYWKFPSYERVFRMVQTHVITLDAFTGDYDHDARLVYSAFASGRTYVSFENFGDTRGFSFNALSPESIHIPGDIVSNNDVDRFEIQIPAEERVRIYLKTPEKTVAVHDGAFFKFDIQDHGRYFVEVFQLRRTLFGGSVEVPWIITNIITVR